MARRQVAAGASGITVSALKEAEEFFAGGFGEILYAVCIPACKLDRALALRRKGCARRLLVDSRRAMARWLLGTLSGELAGRGNVDRAATIAKGIDGVKSVLNRLTVKSAG